MYNKLIIPITIYLGQRTRNKNKHNMQSFYITIQIYITKEDKIKNVGIEITYTINKCTVYNYVCTKYFLLKGVCKSALPDS